MIDREKVLYGLEQIADTTQRSDLQELIEGAIALLKEQEWKFITEDSDGILYGLPGDDGQYLMTDGRDIWIDNYMDGVDDGIFLDSGRDVREIEAWMYMPKLPDEGR